MPNIDTIDERVVEMKIDNRQFVKGANKTITVLDKLKDALSFKNATKGFEDVSKAANKVDFSGMSKQIQNLENKLDYLGSKAHRIMENIVDSIYGFANRTIKMLTTDQITAGWSKYEDITSSIHTIMGATANNWEQTLERISRDYGFVGSQMDYVTQQMEKLNWFTDETSASLTDMVNNIGKFTNAGVELDQATISMMGISTWGYKSGATINEISRAMYNLSQSMALGEVRLMDWRSIENANMATIEFKQTVLDTAVELGKLKKVSDGVYRTIGKNTEVTATNFNEALSEGWFSSDVLQATLYQYGHFANLLNEVVDTTGLSTRDMLDIVEDYKNGTYDAVEWQNKLYQTMGKQTPSVNALNYAVELLTKSEDDLGHRAFLASQETKTLTEAIEYTKDAVSSGWMKTWQYIFGDYEEAKELWGDVTDELYELFVKAGERRNAILSFWKDEGGRDALLESLWNVYDAIMRFVEPIRRAFKTIFGLDDDPKIAAQTILNLTERFRKFTETLYISEDTLKGMQVVFTKLFSGVKTGFTYLQKVLSVVGKVFGYVNQVVGAFFRAFSSGTFDSTKFLGELNNIFGDIINKIQTGWNRLKKFLEGLYDVPVVGPLLKIIIALFEKFGDIATVAWERLKQLKVSGEDLEGPLKFFNDILNNIWKKISGIDLDSKKLKTTFNQISDIITGVWQSLIGDTEGLRATIRTFFKNIWTALVEEAKNIDFEKLLKGAKAGVLLYIAAKFADIATSFRQATKAIKSIPEAITGVFTSVSDTFKALQKSINANIYIKIAMAIGILAWAILQLSQIDDNKFMTVAATLVIVFALLAKAAKSLEKSTMFSGDRSSKTGIVIQNLSKFAQSLIGMAALVAAAAYAMYTIKELSAGQIIKGFIVISAIVAVATFAINKLDKAATNEQGSLKTLIKLTTFAGIIKAVGVALIGLSQLPISNILVAAIAMGAVIAAVSLLVSQTAKIKGENALGVMGILIAISLAIISLVGPLVLLSTLAKNNLSGLIWAADIIGILAIVCAAFIAIGAKLGNTPGLKNFAVSLVIIASAMLLFSIAARVMLPVTLALIGALAGLIALARSMSDEEFSAMAGKIALFGAALLPLAIVLVLVGTGMALFGAGALAAALAVGVFSASILGVAASIALIALAVNLLVSAVKKVVETVAEYGDEFTKVLETLLLSVVALFLGYRMYLANSVLTIILTIIMVIVNVGGDKLIEAIRVILLKLANFLYQIVGLIADVIVGFIVYLLSAVTNSIQKNKEALIIALERLIGTILSLAVETAIRLLFDSVDAIFKGFLSIFGLKADQSSLHFSQWGKSLADGVGEGISSGFESTYRLAEASGEKTGGTLVDMAAEGAEAKMPDLSGVLTTGISGGLNDMNGIVDEDSPKIGSNVIAGIGNGMWDAYPDLQGTIGDITGNITTDFANGLQINSPSKITTQFGRYWDLGLAFGIRDNVGEIDSANQELSNKLNDALLTSMGLVGKIANEDLALRPLIKPVVDLSDVNSANGLVSGMFKNYGGIDIGAINSRVREATDHAATVSASVNAFGESFGSAGDSFVINIYSQPGMDENELANAVMYKIQNGIIRKGAALG